jgi:hypothetical protein
VGTVVPWPYRSIAVVLLAVNLAVLPAAAEVEPVAPGLPDPHVWAKRNIALIRNAVEGHADPKSSEGVGVVLGFSLAYNPLLAREPYATEVLKIIERAINDPPANPEVHSLLSSSVEFLRRPETERVLRRAMRQLDGSEDGGKFPAVKAGREDSVTSDLLNLPPGEPFDSLILETIEEVDRVARQAGNCGRPRGVVSVPGATCIEAEAT